ncbi:hypothetical protein [Hymenobacter properus]|uniref:Uncharacterized protein n=1 Tax=Hymenobacter properus TaxID=2791026 RepID=A0A931BLT9_9BACT|nr:hypothetical protein [Hymenobacter properus]MBF9141820.1 hypothetical protein [Hymenobacter properus]MBR7720628.1 hypothetical protein [Microvirga sp. SRT04]
MKRPPLPALLLLPLLAVLLFGNCSQNVYRVLGPGTTPAQVAQLKELDHNAETAYQATFTGPNSLPGPTARQILDSATAARQRLLSPEQYRRYKGRNFWRTLRYPKRPPRGYR